MRDMKRPISAQSFPVQPPADRIFTTGQVAKMLGISQQTVIRCVDRGRLKGFRLPGSRFRRIPAASLRAFVTEYGMEMPPELVPPPPQDLTAAC